MSNEPDDTERTDSPSLLGDASEYLRSRRSFMADAATVGGGVLALSALGGTAAAEGHEGDGGNGSGSGDVSDVDVLNYALSLEHLEAAYYNGFLDEHSESEVENSDVVKYFARPTLRYSVYQQIQDVATTRRPTSRRSRGPSTTSAARPSNPPSTSSPMIPSRSSSRSPIASKPSASRRTPGPHRYSRTLT